MADRLTLNVVQAREGDCLVLEADVAGASATVLVDGGPAGVFAADLAPVLDQLSARGRRLDRVVLSHVDADHVAGLLDLFAALRNGPAASRPVAIAADGLWHNQFSQTLDPNGAIEPRLAGLLAALEANTLASPDSRFSLDGIAQGDRLLRLAAQVACPVNVDFAGAAAQVGAPPVNVGPLRFTVVGPSVTTLAALRVEWEDWLADREAHVANGEPALAAFLDKSVPNLSSIQLLVEAAGARLLLTGDGRGDHLLLGLEEAGLLDARGRIHVDVFKLPHHGSDRNVDRALFERITADTYVVSADGKHGNPDLPTLVWLVEAAAGRHFTLVCTNRTPSLERLLQAFPPAVHGYTVRVRAPGAHAVEVVVR